MVPRKPISFIVARHLLTHPGDGVTDLVRHTTPRFRPESALDKGSVSKARQRLQKTTGVEPEILLETLRSLPERPRWKTVHLHLPEAARLHEQWHFRVPVKHWFSGEVGAATVDQVPIMPAKILVYVRPADLDTAVRFTIDEFFARFTERSHANFTIRAKDPWIYSDESEGGGWYVERGQRLIDYRESKNVHLLRYKLP